jgi:hypothetical protein
MTVPSDSSRGVAQQRSVLEAAGLQIEQAGELLRDVADHGIREPGCLGQ